METEAKQKRPRGTGSIYKQAGSRYWWVCYYVDGQARRESSGKEKITEARDYLRKQINKADNGELPSPDARRITVAELFKAVVTDYKNNGKTVEWVERVWKLHLEPFWGTRKAANVSTDQIARYVEQRKGEAAKNGTINRELALLRRAFSLGYNARPRKVAAPLKLSDYMLKEDNARKGFVDETQYRALVEKVNGRPWLRAMLTLGYNYGFRKAELLGIKAGQVDLLARTIRLNPGETKNGEGRTVRLTDECYILVQELMRGKRSEDSLITRTNGHPVKDFRETWAQLTEAAGLNGLLFHDLRRSAVRNMVRRGVSEKVAMKISGHKTRSVFDRYNIVDEADLADAALKIEQGGKAELARAVEKAVEENMHSSYIVGQQQERAAN